MKNEKHDDSGRRSPGSALRQAIILDLPEQARRTMSKQANTKLIGGFVVGAIVLTVAGILLFGSGKFFSHQRKFVLFFEDSVKGLNIGSAVDFRGVNIGKVKDIKVVVAKDDFSLLIPVFIEIDPDRITFESAESKLRQLVEIKERICPTADRQRTESATFDAEPYHRPAWHSP